MSIVENGAAQLSADTTGAPSATTAVPTSTHTHTAGAVSGAAASSTASITVAKVRMQQHFGALAAPGTNWHAQFAGGAAIDEAPPWAIVARVPARTVQIARGGAGVATVYTITGTDCDDQALVETINSAGAATVQGTRAFKTITRIQSDVDPTVTTDVQTGNGFGLGCIASDIDGVGVDGALEAPVSSHAASGTVVPTTVPNGAHLYTVSFRVLPTASDSGHQHNAGTLAVAVCAAPSATTTVASATHVHAESE